MNGAKKLENKEECREMGERIKQFRKQLGLSQDEFATKLGLKQRTLSYIERVIGASCVVLLKKCTKSSA